MGSEITGHGFQWTQWLAALAASSAMFSFNSLDIVWMSGAKMAEINSSVLNTIFVTFGAIVGAVFADRFGRKNSLLIMLILTIPRTISFVLDDVVLFERISFFIDISSGITCTLVPLYISEISGTNNCGNLMVMQLFVVLSGILSIYIPYILKGYDYYSYVNGPYGLAIFVVSISFHALILGMFPETPQYLNWKKMYHETAQSLTFFRRIKHVKIIKNPKNLTVDSSKGKFSEVISFKNLRNLAIIFTLIMIKSATGIRGNFFAVMSLIRRYDWSSGINVPGLTFCASSLIFVLIIMLTIGVLARKLSLLLVIFGSLAASTIGMTPLIHSTWILFAVITTQYLTHLIFVGVTLACVGNYFPINVRATAIAFTMTFEIMIVNIIRGIQSACLEVGATSISHEHFAFLSGTHIVAFFLLLFLFPKTNEVSSSEIAIDTSIGTENL